MQKQQTNGREPQDFVAIASVLTSFGVRGEIKARILTDFPERFKKTKEVYLVAKNGEYSRHTLQSSRFHQGYILLKLSGIDAPEMIAPYRGWSISVTPDQLVPLEEGEYWHFQLKGLKVIDQHNVCRGRIFDIYSYPGCDQYAVRDGVGHELVIPAVERFIKKVDLENGCLLVELPEEEA
ncbi:MAG: ribosome maturation factor RimM [Candidatus Bruticola sp.]